MGEGAGFSPAGAPPQVIPRPAIVRPGPPSPWSGLSVEARRGLDLGRVKAALTTPIDVNRTGGESRQSSVLVPLFEDEGETRVVLTRRAATLRSHRSEVSFPGGGVNLGEGLVAAALREAHEEVALDPASVTVIGSLRSLTTVSSATLISPWVGVLERRPVLSANPAEVERVFDVALADLIVDGVHHSERWVGDGLDLELHFFDLPGDIVWGATGRMLVELLTRVAVGR
jgi:8-oxo-dGTP pyrophosphatase MutT (NUDIX family)